MAMFFSPGPKPFSFPSFKTHHNCLLVESCRKTCWTGGPLGHEGHVRCAVHCGRFKLEIKCEN